MEIQDLGELQGDVLLCGGPYSNLHATQAFQQLCEEQGIPSSNVICTGDLAAYCAFPKETIDLVRSAGWPIVAGNCEKQLAAGALDCGCGFEGGTECDLLSAGWYAHASKEVTPEQCDWMGGLPDLAIFTHASRHFAVIHGGFTNISRFIWSVSDDAVFAEEIAAIEHQVGTIDGVVSGHSGLAFTKTIKGKLWINAGALGMPANSGQTTTQYVRLSAKDLSIENLTYDVHAAQTSMQRVGLVQGYHKALQTGYWPSEDVLPASLKRKT